MTLLFVIHVLVCTFLVAVILIQPGKADGGIGFGSASSQSIFGSKGAGNFLTKITTVVAIVFMATSIGLAYVSTHRTGSSIIKETRPKKAAPVLPPTPVEKGTPIAPPAQPAPPASK